MHLVVYPVIVGAMIGLMLRALRDWPHSEWVAGLLVALLLALAGVPRVAFSASKNRNGNR